MFGYIKITQPARTELPSGFAPFPPAGLPDAYRPAPRLLWRVVAMIGHVTPAHLAPSLAPAMQPQACRLFPGEYRQNSDGASGSRLKGLPALLAALVVSATASNLRAI